MGVVGGAGAVVVVVFEGVLALGGAGGDGGFWDGEGLWGDVPEEPVVEDGGCDGVGVVQDEGKGLGAARDAADGEWGVGVLAFAGVAGGDGLSGGEGGAVEFKIANGGEGRRGVGGVAANRDDGIRLRFLGFQKTLDGHSADNATGNRPKQSHSTDLMHWRTADHTIASSYYSQSKPRFNNSKA